MTKWYKKGKFILITVVGNKIVEFVYMLDYMWTFSDLKFFFRLLLLLLVLFYCIFTYRYILTGSLQYAIPVSRLSFYLTEWIKGRTIWINIQIVCGCVDSFVYTQFCGNKHSAKYFFPAWSWPYLTQSFRNLFRFSIHKLSAFTGPFL